MTRSADSNREPGETVGVKRTRATEATKETPRMEAAKSLKEIVRHHPVRVGKGKTSRL